MVELVLTLYLCVGFVLTSMWSTVPLWFEPVFYTWEDQVAHWVVNAVVFVIVSAAWAGTLQWTVPVYRRYWRLS